MSPLQSLCHVSRIIYGFLGRQVGILLTGALAALLVAGDDANAQESIPLAWDPGTTAEGTVFVQETTVAVTDYVYRIRTENPASGAWRTVLHVTAGNADLYLRRGLVPDPAVVTSVDHKSVRAAGDEGLVLNPATQFTVGEDYYILVRAQAGSAWRLVSGDLFIEDLGGLGYADANSDGKFDPGEVVVPQLPGPRTIGGEGAVFYRVTVPDGVPAWSLSLNGQQNKLAVRKNFVPFQASSSYDVQKTGRMLLVPDYLQASTAGSAYFISVSGAPGSTVNLDSRIHSFTDIAFDSSIAVSGTGAGYRSFRVTVPPNQLAWAVSATPLSGDPHVCLRRDKVPSENDNNPFWELFQLPRWTALRCHRLRRGMPWTASQTARFSLRCIPRRILLRRCAMVQWKSRRSASTAPR